MTKPTTNEIMQMDLTNHLTDEIIMEFIRRQKAIGAHEKATISYARMIAGPLKATYHSKLCLHKVILDTVNAKADHKIKNLGDGEYEYRGCIITRNDDVPGGYWGRWRCGPRVAATRRELIDAIDARKTGK